MTRKGNNDRMTFNYGHDVAKTRLSAKIKASGFDIYAVRKAIFNHPTIQQLISCKAILISDIVGQNFTISCKNKLYAEFASVKFNNNQIVVQVVNNIIKSILQGFILTEYGKTEYWKKLNKKLYKYSDRLYIGADILSYKWIKDNYSQSSFTCELSDREKNKKYQRG